MTWDYDVAIAGLGPAGSAAALTLAGAGFRVLAVERREFPRDKLCGGLLTWKSMRVLERLAGMDAAALVRAGVIDHVAAEYVLRLRGRMLLGGRTAYPFHLVRRRDFDAFLAGRARMAGAEVVFGETVAGTDPEAGRLMLASGREVRARFVIGADGVGSRVRGAVGCTARAWKRDLAQAMEVKLPLATVRALPGAHPDLTGGSAGLYAGFVKAGYAWVFPNTDAVVVGLGGLIRSNPGAFAGCFRDFLSFLGLPADLMRQARGHSIPYGNYLSHPARGRVLLAGDAAGLVEPFFGEGIFYAMRSGELAARAVIAHPDDPWLAGAAYRERLGPILTELAWSKRWRAVLYTALRLGLVAPMAAFLRGGGSRLLDMVHGRRSFKLLAPLSEADYQ